MFKKILFLAELGWKWCLMFSKGSTPCTRNFLYSDMSGNNKVKFNLSVHIGFIRGRPCVRPYNFMLEGKPQVLEFPKPNQRIFLGTFHSRTAAPSSDLSACQRCQRRQKFRLWIIEICILDFKMNP